MRCDRELEAVAWILAVLEARTAAAPQISMGAINDNGFDKSLDGTCFTSVKLIKQLIRPRQRRGHSLQLFYFPLVIFLPCPSSFSFRKHRSRCSHLFFFLHHRDSCISLNIWYSFRNIREKILVGERMN